MIKCQPGQLQQRWGVRHGEEAAIYFENMSTCLTFHPLVLTSALVSRFGIEESKLKISSVIICCHWRFRAGVPTLALSTFWAG